MANTQWFLVLAQEFGGQTFGPFDGYEIKLGSGPGMDLTLPASLGVEPHHVSLIRQGDSFVVSPVARSAAVMLWRAGNGPRPVAGPVALSPGSDAFDADGFSLVSEQGPRFYLVSRQASAAADAPARAAAKRVTGRSLLQEVRAEGITRVLTTKGGASAQRWWTYVRTGAILRPRNVVIAAGGAFGWLFAGGMMASLVAVASNKTSAETALVEAEKRIEVLESTSASSDKEPKLAVLAGDVLGDPAAWRRVFDDDPDLEQRFAKRLKSHLSSDQRMQAHAWVYRRSHSAFAELAKAMSGFDPQLARVFPYVAAAPGPRTDRGWELVNDATGEASCGRGPALLTWRQAARFGLDGLPDAVVDTTDLEAAGVGRKLDWLERSAQSLRGGPAVELDGVTLAEAQVSSSGDTSCLYVAGDDQRDSASAVAAALDRALGVGAAGVPGSGASTFTVNRLARLFAADMPSGFDDIDFAADEPLDLVLDDAHSSAGREYVRDAVAEVLARAVAIPCNAVLDRRQEKVPAHLPGKLPSPYTCIMLSGMASRGLF